MIRIMWIEEFLIKNSGLLMAISRAQMKQQVSKPGMKKNKKVATALRKASKKHANQAKKLQGV